MSTDWSDIVLVTRIFSDSQTFSYFDHFKVARHAHTSGGAGRPIYFTTLFFLIIVPFILLFFCSRYIYIYMFVYSIYNCISTFPYDTYVWIIIVIWLRYDRAMIMMMMMTMMWDIDNNKMKYVLRLLTHDVHRCQKMKDV